MYNHQGLVELQKKFIEAVDKLVGDSELVCSEYIQIQIKKFLKSSIDSVESMSGLAETIFLMNHWGKSTSELYNEYPEKYNSPN